MVAFMVGCDPDDDLGQFEQMMQLMSETDGFMEARPLRENVALVCFRDRESARTAQWMLQLNGALELGGDN